LQGDIRSARIYIQFSFFGLQDVTLRHSGQKKRSTTDRLSTFLSGHNFPPRGKKSKVNCQPTELVHSPVQKEKEIVNQQWLT
jgi:hypothetical protein